MPDWKPEIRRRLASCALRPTREIEIVDELAEHLEERYTRLRAVGASEHEAVARAWRELDDGDLLAREVARVESPAPLNLPPPGTTDERSWLRGLWQDVRYSARSLRASPGFSITVMLAVALSTGPVAAIVSVGNWLLWRPHPGVADSSSLAVVWFGRWTDTGVSPSGVSHANLEDIRARARSISGIAGVQETTASLGISGAPPSQIQMAFVTADFFEVLGVRLSAGRTFTADEDRGRFGAPVVVVSERLARSAFGAPDAALGKSISLNSRPFSVIGIAAADFGGITNTGGIDAWLTGATLPYLNHVKEPRAQSRADGPFYQFVVRSTPGVTFLEVESELKVIARQLADAHPAENEKFLAVAPRVFPGLGLPAMTRKGTTRIVNTLVAVGCVLLLLGCANVANLLVFRAARREQEIAVRKALGASRLRLLQLQSTESWLLAVAGAALGLALALYLKQLIEQLLFPRPPGMSFDVPIDGRVLAFTVLVAFATGTFAALAPGWLAARTRGLATLTRTTFTSSRAPKLRAGLAVLQLALSLSLFVGALLLVSTLRNLRAVDLGLDPAGVTVLYFSLNEHGYDTARGRAYHAEVLTALQAAGEFEDVSVAMLAPFGSSHSVRVLPPDGSESNALLVRANAVGESYFRLLSIPIIRGRGFTADEIAGRGGGSPLVVNQTLAKRLFGTDDVVGRMVRLARTASNPLQELVIVGVAADSRWRSIAGEQDPFLYRPFGLLSRGVTNGVYMVRSRLPSHRVGEIANAIAARTASDIPLSMARPLTMSIDRELSERRVFAWMLSLLAALGFVLATLGLYGLIAQATTERRREFGIRLALGASSRDIVRLVARYAVLVSMVGVAMGLLLAYFGTRIIQSMLFGVSPLEPDVYLAAVLTLTAVVTLACALPARRAMRVPAAEVLRAE